MELERTSDKKRGHKKKQPLDKGFDDSVVEVKEIKLHKKKDKTKDSKQKGKRMDKQENKKGSSLAEGSTRTSAIPTSRSTPALTEVSRSATMARTFEESEDEPFQTRLLASSPPTLPEAQSGSSDGRLSNRHSSAKSLDGLSKKKAESAAESKGRADSRTRIEDDDIPETVPLYDLEEMAIDVKGYLHVATVKRFGVKFHQTRKVSKWKRRWVRLYRDEDGGFMLELLNKHPVHGKKSAAKGTLNLRTVRGVETRDDIRRYAMVLLPRDVDKEDPIYLCSETSSERRRWMEAFSCRLVTQRLNSRSPAMSVTASREEETKGADMRMRTEVKARTNVSDRHLVISENKVGREQVEHRKATLTSTNAGKELDQAEDEEERMMREIEKHMNDIRAGHSQSVPAFIPPSLSSMPSFYHSQPHQHQAMMNQHQQQRQDSILRQHSQPHIFVSSAPHPQHLVGTYNPFVETSLSGSGPTPSASLSSSFVRLPTMAAPFRPSDLSSSFSNLPQAQTVVMSTITPAALASSPSLSSSSSSIGAMASPLTLSAVPPTPHIPPPFMRQSSLLLKQQLAAHYPLAGPASPLAPTETQVN